MQIGDGTNFVIMFAAKLLEKAENLLRMVCPMEGLPVCVCVCGWGLQF